MRYAEYPLPSVARCTQPTRPLHVADEMLRHSDWIDGKRHEETLNYFRDRKLIGVTVDMPRIKESTIMPGVDEVTWPELAYL